MEFQEWFIFCSNWIEVYLIFLFWVFFICIKVCLVILCVTFFNDVTFFDMVIYVSSFVVFIYVLSFDVVLCVPSFVEVNDGFIYVVVIVRVSFCTRVVNEVVWWDQRVLFGHLLWRRILALRFEKKIYYKTWIISLQNLFI